MVIIKEDAVTQPSRIKGIAFNIGGGQGEIELAGSPVITAVIPLVGSRISRNDGTIFIEDCNRVELQHISPLMIVGIYQARARGVTPLGIGSPHITLAIEQRDGIALNLVANLGHIGVIGTIEPINWLVVVIVPSDLLKPSMAPHQQAAIAVIGHPRNALTSGNTDDSGSFVIGAFYPIAVGERRDGILDVYLATFGKDNIHDIFKFGDARFQELVVDVTARAVISEQSAFRSLGNHSGHISGVRIIGL